MDFTYLKMSLSFLKLDLRLLKLVLSFLKFNFNFLNMIFNYLKLGLKRCNILLHNLPFCTYIPNCLVLKQVGSKQVKPLGCGMRKRREGMFRIPCSAEENNKQLQTKDWECDKHKALEAMTGRCLCLPRNASVPVKQHFLRRERCKQIPVRLGRIVHFHR